MKGNDNNMPYHKRSKTVEHTFYCMNCGNKYQLQRRVSFQKERFHRKKLYCCFCKATVNHIECKTYEDALEFETKFNKGEFIKEARESMQYVEKGEDLFNASKMSVLRQSI